MNHWGRHLRLNLFGESHGPGVGITLDGVPAGTAVDLALLHEAMELRRPGTSRLVTARQERDEVQFLSGIQGAANPPERPGVPLSHRIATGAPLTLWIPNEDTDSRPYDAQAGYRPGHADVVEAAWSHGAGDGRGGGHQSGRLTAPLVAAGVVAQAILGPTVQVGAHVQQVGDLVGPDIDVPARTMLERVPASIARTAHASMEAAFVARIEAARTQLDSVGAVVAFAADGVPPLLGMPHFAGVEGHLASLLLSVPAVKGVDFGAGFAAAAMTGSQHNDAMRSSRDEAAGPGGGSGMPHFATNHAGGVLGGRTTGQRLHGRVAVKPTSSIFKPQATVDRHGKDTTLRLTGRHDPCIALRAVPVVQACVRLALADLLLQARLEGHLSAAPPTGGP